jgi:hypothetical protein
MVSLSAESICLVDRKKNIIQPMVPAEQGFFHFNNLWCYLFYKLTGKEKDDKGIAAFSIVLSKNPTITAILDRVFPAIVATNNQPMPRHHQDTGSCLNLRPCHRLRHGLSSSLPSFPHTSTQGIYSQRTCFHAP